MAWRRDRRRFALIALRAAALAALACPDPDDKLRRVAQLCESVAPGAIVSDSTAQLVEPPGLPGRPTRPPLVPHSRIKQQSAATLKGRAALLHAIAHIEFNAINLALDALWRFADLPDQYYRDWLTVAGEEALHFTLLRDHLRGLGSDYGDFPAHQGLWEMAERTRADSLARLALVPRTLEARGLDASPQVKAKLLAAGDARAGEILDVILRDEIGHVAIGNRWYRWLSERRGLDPVALYPQLAAQYDAPRPRGPFNLSARRAAGFTEAELAQLGDGSGPTTP